MMYILKSFCLLVFYEAVFLFFLLHFPVFFDENCYLGSGAEKLQTGFLLNLHRARALGLARLTCEPRSQTFISSLQPGD